MLPICSAARQGLREGSAAAVLAAVLAAAVPTGGEVGVTAALTALRTLERHTQQPARVCNVTGSWCYLPAPAWAPLAFHEGADGTFEFTRTEARQHCRRHRIVDTGGAARRAPQPRITGPRAREAVRVEAVRLVTAELHVGAVLALVERLQEHSRWCRGTALSGVAACLLLHDEPQTLSTSRLLHRVQLV